MFGKPPRSGGLASSGPPSSCGSSTITIAAQPRNNATSRPATVLTQLQKGLVEVRATTSSLLLPLLPLPKEGGLQPQPMHQHTGAAKLNCVKTRPAIMEVVVSDGGRLRHGHMDVVLFR